MAEHPPETNAAPERDAVSHQLPMQDDLAYALQHGSRIAVGMGLPMDDLLWVVGALRTADAFSIAATWWNTLGVEDAQKKGMFLLKQQLEKRQHKTPSGLTVRFQRFQRELRRLAFSLLFMDVPEERRAVKAYLTDSPLYQRSHEIATTEGARGVDWVHWFAALQQLHPDWVKMLNMAPEELHLMVLKQKQNKLKRETPKRFILYWGKEFLQFFILFSVLLIIARQGIAEPRLIPSGSMEPTLEIGDRIMIEKPSKLLNLGYQRGDVLVFVPPYARLNDDFLSQYLRLTGLSGYLPPLNDTLRRFNIESPLPSADEVDLAYIKRVVAVGGDTVNVVPGVGVYVNGRLLKEPYKADVSHTCTQEEPRICAPVEVPEGYYFMMGDNRNNSRDSRYWGFLPEDRVLGRAILRFWPLNRVALIDESAPDDTPQP